MAMIEIQPIASRAWEASNPKLQAPERVQTPNLNVPPWMATTPLGPWFGA
jgi:hypothetical protein